VELIVLGSGGTWPRPRGATSGYLLQHEGFNLWVDAGTGTFSRLQEHIGIGDIGGVLITHAHPDHFVDIYPCFYARHYGGLGDPGMPLVAPEDFWGHMSGLVSEDGVDVAADTFDVRPTAPGADFELGPFRIRSYEMTHIGVQSLGYRIEVAGKVFCEATWEHDDGLLPFHMSARQAGEHAARAGAETLVLTHIWPTLDPEDSRAEAAGAFDGTIEIARGGRRWRVGE
jgi:ribonuclease BN (tRNA processing enzyme)